MVVVESNENAENLEVVVPKIEAQKDVVTPKMEAHLIRTPTPSSEHPPVKRKLGTEAAEADPEILTAADFAQAMSNVLRTIDMSRRDVKADLFELKRTLAELKKIGAANNPVVARYQKYLRENVPGVTAETFQTIESGINQEDAVTSKFSEKLDFFERYG